MTVFVDEVRFTHFPKPKPPFDMGFCHMTADPVEELHAMARKLKLRRSWFQDGGTVPHYDLTPRRRELAIDLGAEFVPAKEQARRRIANRRE